jgi:outer membrane protein TolC
MKQFTYWYLSATIFLTVSSFGEQQPFPLDKCVAVGFEHNKNLIPFARLDFESAMCDHAGRSPHNVDFTSMLTTVAQNTNDSLVGAAFAANQMETGTLYNGLVYTAPLLSGGTSEWGITAPLHFTKDGRVSSARLPLSVSGKINQPLFPSDIGLKKLDIEIYNDNVRKIKKAYRTALEEYIIRLAQAYYTCSDARTQRERVSNEINRVKGELEIAEIKKQSGAISSVELKAAQVTLVQLELSRQTVVIAERKADEILTDLLGVPLPDSVTFTGIATMDSTVPPLDSITLWYFDYDENLRDLEKIRKRFMLKKSILSLFSPMLELYGEITPLTQKWTGPDSPYTSSISPWSLSGSITATLVSGRQLRLDRHRARLDFEKTELQINDAKRMIERQARDHYFDAVDIRQRVAVANQALQSAEQVFDMEQEKFRLGEISRVELEQHAENKENAAKTLESAKINFILLQLKMLQLKGTLLAYFHIRG